MNHHQASATLADLGLEQRYVVAITRHLADADAHGKHGQGFARIPWIQSLSFDPDAIPSVDRDATDSFQRWRSNGALGYVAMWEAVCATLRRPPRTHRLILVDDCFPTGALGVWARMFADANMTALVTSTSPRRLPHPDGGPPLTGTNPIAIAVASSEGDPIVADVSMGAVTYGDVLEGKAQLEDLVPFGGEQAHKAFALAVGVQLMVEALTGTVNGAVMLVGQPVSDPVPMFRALAGDVHLPGDM